MRIGILGTRGIPNYHGGFEQFAEFFAVFAAEKGHEVYVYNSSLHPYQKKSYKGVHLIHCTDTEDKMGTPGQFVYDFNCLKDARKRKFDVLLQLGYTSNAIWFKLLPKDAIVVTNMDGLEWKRSKYSAPVQRFLKWSEKLAVKSSDYLISDSKGIQSYLLRKYAVESKFIAYGADMFSNPDLDALNEFDVQAYHYHMLIARMEPENNIEMILDGYIQTDMSKPFLVIGNAEATSFGKRILSKYKKFPQVRFLGAIYDLNKLNNLRYFSEFYFHGHSVGGTNPSLLEAMASQACIVAHKNEFNQAILDTDAYYFSTEQEVAKIISKEKRSVQFISLNAQKIKDKYTWSIINQEYLDYLTGICT